MSAYTVVERDFDSFFRVPFEQYGPDEAYVSPLRSDLRTMVDGAMNPVFRDPDQITYFTVLSGGTPVGRITA
ncbi:MAG: GNAT family N-acetyltransferase, partial [Gemmatimonadota bacterium]